MKKLFIAVVSFGILAVACKKDEETLNFEDSKYKVALDYTSFPDLSDTILLASNDSVYLKGIVGLGKWSYDGDSLFINAGIFGKLSSNPSEVNTINGNISAASVNVGTFTGTKVN